ncbi:MAG: lipid-A-disaccharide synthase [Granulosicoccus sp.]|nr:lipid-A-disaccharide synthase [Granulosicoccus sp.]
MNQTLSIMVSAGEASGDAHAAHALQALSELGVAGNSFGMGAGALQQQGTELIVDCRDLAVIGFADVLKNYPRFIKRLRLLRRTLEQRHPDILLLVDYPDFNLKLAETAKALGIPVLFYISPKVWAWRSGRIQRIASLVTHMAVLFPFEVPIYEKAGVAVTYVGNPVVKDAVSEFDRDEACIHFGLSPRHKVIALLPGSRHGEIKRNLPIMIDTAQIIREQSDEIQFLLPIAPTLDESLLRSSTNQVLPDFVHLTRGDSRDAMRAADAALVASGTATLETALIGTPMIVMYVINALNYAVMKRLIKIPDISLVNIVAKRRIVPEYLQHEAQAELIAADLLSLIHDADRRTQMQEDLTQVKLKMGDSGASRRVAELLISVAEQEQIH